MLQTQTLGRHSVCCGSDLLCCRLLTLRSRVYRISNLLGHRAQTDRVQRATLHSFNNKRSQKGTFLKHLLLRLKVLSIYCVYCSSVFTYFFTVISFVRYKSYHRATFLFVIFKDTILC